MANWKPQKVIERAAARLQQEVSRAIASAAPPVAHRGSQAGPPGGSLAKAVLAKSLIVRKRWGVVIQWSKLGQRLMWFINGTSRQKPRPVKLVPGIDKLRAVLEADAARHYGARAKQEKRA